MCANVQTEPLISAWLYLFAFFLFNPHSVGLVILRLYKRMYKCSQLFIERLRAQLKQALWVRMQSDCVRDSHTGEMCQNTKLFTKNSCALHGYPGFHSCHGSPADASFLSNHHLNLKKHSDHPQLKILFDTFDTAISSKLSVLLKTIFILTRTKNSQSQKKATSIMENVRFDLFSVCFTSEIFVGLKV